MAAVEVKKGKEQLRQQMEPSYIINDPIEERRVKLMMKQMVSHMTAAGSKDIVKFNIEIEQAQGLQPSNMRDAVRMYGNIVMNFDTLFAKMLFPIEEIKASGQLLSQQHMNMVKDFATIHANALANVTSRLGGLQ